MTDTVSGPLPLPGRPGSSEHLAYLALQRLAARQQYAAGELLRQHDLSGPQFNVLRILRGAGDGGLRCSDIGARLLVHDPDVTRLLDRLEKAGRVRRARDPHDRRVVMAYLTEEGRAVLGTLDAPLTELHARQFAALSPERLALLVALLGDLTPEDHP